MEAKKEVTRKEAVGLWTAPEVPAHTASKFGKLPAATPSYLVRLMLRGSSRQVSQCEYVAVK
jgi:hypothetical protein